MTEGMDKTGLARSRGDFLKMMENNWKGFEAKVIERKGIDLVRLPAAMNSNMGIWIPVFEPESCTELGLILGMIKEVGKVDFDEKMTTSQREAMMYGVGELNLPVAVAVHGAMNMGMDKGEMKKMYGESDSKEMPMMVALIGPARAGKSMFGRYVEIEYGIPTVSVDGYGAVTLGEYRQAGTVKELLSMKVSAKNGVGEWDTKRALEVLSEVYMTGKRPEILLVDFPGYHIGLDGLMTRPKETLDILGKQSGMVVATMSRYGGNASDEAWLLLKDGAIDRQILEEYTIGIKKQIDAGRWLARMDRERFLKAII